MAQYASRASVNLHTHLFFKNQPRDEEGYVLMIKQNAVQVLIPKYGLEGTLYLRKGGTGDRGGGPTPEFVYDPDVPSQTCAGVTLTLFQKVSVRILLDDSNVQHEKLVLKLVSPTIQGFSVEPNNETAKSGTKRKSAELEQVGNAKKCKK